MKIGKKEKKQEKRGEREKWKREKMVKVLLHKNRFIEKKLRINLKQGWQHALAAKHWHKTFIYSGSTENHGILLATTA